MINRLLHSLIAFILVSCGSSKKHDYDYVNLNTFIDDSVAIKEGTQLTLLALSGGNDNDKENVYYHQIMVTKSDSDTLIVLCPLLKIPYPDPSTGRNYIEPGEYNYEKGILNATYERKDESLNILLQTLGDLSSNQTVDISSYMDNKITKRQKVAINKSLPIFKNKYKTVVGILSFSVDPR